jgi:predicted Rossmann-fold nucleotide-binding protein
MNERKWIMVAGSGAKELPEKIARTSELLGQELSKTGYGLITGGWPGVDHIVARSFSEGLRKTDIPLRELLIQFVDERRRPDFQGGQTVSAPDDQAWRSSVEKADAIVLIGGLGGTFRTGEMAQYRSKPVFPIAGTGGNGHEDAKRYFSRMMERWAERPIQGISIEDFSLLGGHQWPHRPEAT